MARGESLWSRREFTIAAARAAALVRVLAPAWLAGCRSAPERREPGADAAGAPFFTTRGVVLVPDDLTLADWPERAAAAGLTTIGLHDGLAPSIVADFVHSEPGARFLADCRRLRLAVEYELHAMGDLLPRALFATDRSLFRMDEKGERVADVNLCVHSRTALELVAENALLLDARLQPTTHRRFLWGDDGAPWCRCADCAALSASDQALIVENRVVAALRTVDPEATLAHLAYANTLAPPAQVRPESGVFLEFAPLAMRFERQLVPLADPRNAGALALLDANLALFGASTAQALDYWLDDSMYSNWRKPAQELRWSDEVFESDLATYASRGVRCITSFAVYLDADYVRRFGFPAVVDRYGSRLRAFKPAG